MISCRMEDIAELHKLERSVCVRFFKGSAAVIKNRTLNITAIEIEALSRVVRAHIDHHSREETLQEVLPICKQRIW